MSMQVEMDKTDGDCERWIEHMDRLYSYARVLARNNSDAEDLVQETYARALAAIGRLRPDSNTRAWLLIIMRNIWLNQLRKWRGEPDAIYIDAYETNADIAVEPSANPYEIYEKKIECEQVRNAIMQLPVYLREIVILREYEELPYHDIAEILDCPVGTVMSRLSRARSKLRELISIDSKPLIRRGKRTSNEDV